MDQTPTPPPPSLPATATATATAPSATYPDSLDSSPRSRKTDSWGEDNSVHPSNNGSITVAPQAGLTKLRLMCSYGGHIVPRPHDKSLCYIGGDTRIVVVDRHTTLSDLTQRLSKTLLRSSSSSSLTTTTASFTLKYQLPSEDLDSLISVTTDEDLENMIEEYERLNSASDVNKSSRLRLFLFPTKPESASSIGSLLENSTKSEDWFLNALNGTTSGFSDTSSVNCLLGLEDDVPVQEKKDADQKSIIGKNPKGNTSAQDVHSVPDLERTSSFGSASSSPSLASLPPIRVHVEDSPKVGGIEDQFSQMNVHQQLHKHPEDGGYVAAPAPMVVTAVPLSSTMATMTADYSNRVLSEDERSDQGSQSAYQKQQQQQYQQKQSMGFDSDSLSSDGRQKPSMMYQDQLVQIQSSNTNNRTSDLNNLPDQNTRIQIQQQQQQQIPDSAYLMSMSNTQVDQQHSQQLHHQQQQPQFIHTAVPPPQYIHHHPSGAVPMTSYYQMYPPQNQHHPPLDQQNFVYYMPATRQPPTHGYNMQLQQQPTSYAEPPPASAASQTPSPVYTTARATQTTAKTELPAGVYGTTNSGGSQFVQVPSSQHQPQYVGYSQIHHPPPPQSMASSASGGGPGANYGYEYGDPAQGQHIYYAAQPPMPPHQSSGQYQTVTGGGGGGGGESCSYLPTENNSTKQQQQGRTQ